MDRELVSVLMVNYNRGTTIGESIKSVLAQTYTDLELIIVDDGSQKDRTPEIADEYERRYPGSVVQSIRKMVDMARR